READLAAAVDGDDLHQHLVALIEDVGDLLDALVGDLADVDQPVGAREELHEGAEVGDLADGAGVDAADLRLAGEGLDHGDGLLHALAVRGGDVHAAAVIDVHAAAGARDDVLDHLSARPDDVLDELGTDLDGGDPGRPLADLLAGLGERGEHPLEDVQPTLAGLLQGVAHDLRRQYGALVVHLDGRDALGGAADLEVHVAEVVLVTDDVGEDGDLVALLHQAHGDAGHRRLDGHTGVHERQGATAHRRHRRGAVGLQDVADQAHRVGEVLPLRQHVAQGPLGQRAVTDL